MKIAGLLLVLLFAFPSMAQTYPLRSTSQRIGQFTYTKYSTPHGRMTSSHQRIGQFTYGTYRNGSDTVTSSHQRIGQFTYGTYSDGGRSVTQKIGAIEYHRYTPPPSRRSTAVRSRW